MFKNTSRKLLYCAPHLWKKVFFFHKSFVFKFGEKFIHNRSSVVPHIYRFIDVKIHSGKRWHLRRISRWMVGYKFGEFTWNRKIALYKAKQLKKKKKR